MMNENTSQNDAEKNAQDATHENTQDTTYENTHDNMQNDIKSNLLSPNHWQRFIYMLLFAVFLHIASLMMWVLVALQFLLTLFTGKDNQDLRNLGKDLSAYIYDALNFLTYNTEAKPFPFSSWSSNSNVGSSRHSDGKRDNNRKSGNIIEGEVESVDDEKGSV